MCYIMWEGVFLICEAPSSGRLLGCGHQNPSAFRLVSAVRDGPAWLWCEASGETLETPGVPWENPGIVTENPENLHGESIEMKMFHSVDRPLVIRGLMEKFASENQEIAHQSLSSH